MQMFVQICVTFFLIIGVFFRLWSVILETFWKPFSSFWRFGCQVASGSEKCWKSAPNNQKRLLHFHKKSMFFRSLFPSFFWIVLGCLFLISVAKVSQIRAPWKHFSRHFAAKLERWNLWFGIHQTVLFLIFRGWVWTYRVTFSKWFSKVDPGMSFYVFLWNAGSNRDPKGSLVAQFSL